MKTKLAASNIAWSPAEDAEAAAVLRESGATGVEIAPTAVWKDPTHVSESEARTTRQVWTDRGLPIVALQSLLFGHPELVLFGERAAREATLDYLGQIARLGGWLGARALVFGSPKNRQVGAMDRARAWDQGVAFFREAGRRAADAGTVLCIEPNPPAYGCDFVTTSVEGLELVKEVGSAGFGLHLDAGGMTLAGERADLASLGPQVRAACHFHVSEANLAPIGSGTVEHARFADVLRQASYDRWTSVEMRRPEGAQPLEILRQAMKAAAAAYLG